MVKWFAPCYVEKPAQSLISSLIHRDWKNRTKCLSIDGRVCTICDLKLSSLLHEMKTSRAIRCFNVELRYPHIGTADWSRIQFIIGHNMFIIKSREIYPLGYPGKSDPLWLARYISGISVKLLTATLLSGLRALVRPFYSVTISFFS